MHQQHRLKGLSTVAMELQTEPSPKTRNCSTNIKNYNSTSSPNCSYPIALLPLPHHNVPGNIQERLLRSLLSVPSLLVRLEKSGVLERTSAHGSSGAKTLLISILLVISWLQALLPLQRLRYPSVMRGSAFTSHATSCTSADHVVRYKERVPAASSCRNVTRVCPSAALDLMQEKPPPVTSSEFERISNDKANAVCRRYLLFISVY